MVSFALVEGRERDEPIQWPGGLTVIFRVSANAQTAGLDIREAKADGLAEGGCIHVWDPIMIAYAAV